VTWQNKGFEHNVLTFHTVRYKNFLATGNAFNTISLDSVPKVSVSGKNGFGKTTFLDAICFALYGKPMRNIVKGGLINSVNQKALLVEIEFTTQNNRYLVRRGMKPNIFDIICNGSPIQTLPSVIEMQDYLERYILKCNYKTFTQVVILGSTSYVPFMRLPPAARREVLEDVLDIQVFSVMHTLLKSRMVTTRDKLSDAQSSAAIIESQHQMATSYAAQWTKTQEQKRAEAEAAIAATETTIATNTAEMQTIEEQIAPFQVLSDKLPDLREQHTKASKLVSKFSTQKQHLENSHKFFEDNAQCPTCTQVIEENFKTNQLDSMSAKLEEVLRKLADVNDIVSKLDVQIERATAAHQEVVSLTSKYRQLEERCNANNRELQRLRKDLDATATPPPEIPVGDLDAAKAAVNELIVQRNVLEQGQVLLKDNGIRTRIVNQYLPVINKTVNSYLTALNFPIQFILDEQFKESIKSRGRDEFSYENFSEGEKKRIDIALLLAFCKVAQLKNTVSCNLLIFDEIFDSSLDTNGIDDMMSVLDTLTGKNVFVISHRDMMSDKFDQNLTVTKEKGFSVVKATK